MGVAPPILTPPAPIMSGLARTQAALTQQQFTMDFAIGTKSETTFEGQEGIFLIGYGTKFNQPDAEEEYTDPHSLASAAATFFDQSDGNGPVPILFEHGFDRLLGTKRIGRIVEWRIDEVGLWIKAFMPRPQGALDAIGQKAAQVYESVKRGAINGFSVGGVFGKIGKRIAQLALYEVSVTAAPCLESATFTVAAKSLPAIDEAVTRAVAARNPTVAELIAALQGFTHSVGVTAAVAHSGPAAMGAAETADHALAAKALDYTNSLPPASTALDDAIAASSPVTLDPEAARGEANMADPKQGDTGVQWGLSREAHGKALAIAQHDKSAQLHNHLLHPGNYPTQVQGDHAPSDCAVCQGMRDDYGQKSGAHAPHAPLPPDVTPLAPDAIPLAMTDLARLAIDIAELHAPTSSQSESGSGGESVAVDGKAGRTVSAAHLAHLRKLGDAAMETGQGIHAYCDSYDTRRGED